MTRTGWIATAAIATASLALLAWASMPRPLSVEVSTVARGRFETGIEEEARTRLSDRYAVTAPMAGRLERLALREGDPVRAGQVIAVLQPLAPPLLDDRALAQARARLDVAEASLARARTRIEAARVAVARAEDDLRRSEQLGLEGFISSSRLEDDRLAALAARRDLQTEVEGEHVAVHELDQARAALPTAARARGTSLEEPRVVVLRAPASGRVLRIHQGSENTIAAGTPVLEIGDVARLRIVSELLTADALQTRPGSPVRIERWGGADSLAGRVERIEPAAYTRISALGVEEQRVNVIIEILSPVSQWAGLGDGYRVSVRIVTRSEPDVVKVATGAVFPRPGAAAGDPAHAVFRIVDGRARLTPIRMAARNADEAWVLEGLDPGDQVIVYPPATLRDGMRARIRR